MYPSFKTLVAAVAALVEAFSNRAELPVQSKSWHLFHFWGPTAVAPSHESYWSSGSFEVPAGLYGCSAKVVVEVQIRRWGAEEEEEVADLSFFRPLWS